MGISTSLTAVANKFYLYDTTGTGPTLKYGGVDVVGGEFGTWAPIGAVQTANGYDVAGRSLAPTNIRSGAPTATATTSRA